jgi:ectoine hydroxylase-related dioxygenase (phytanoyl-CoA dioxygenase family)
MKRDGYVVARGFFDAHEIAELASWTEELATAPEVSGRHWVYHEASATQPERRLIQRIENFCPFHEGFAALVTQGALSLWAGALMGGPVVLFKDKINFKMPGGAGFQPHQDQQAGWSRYAPIFLTAMVSVDATTVENGCLEIAPRRPGEGLLGAEWTPLPEGRPLLQSLPTAAGDVIFFDSFVPHASQPNRNGSARRALYLTFNLAEHGEQRARYLADKHAAFPPDIDRNPGQSYVFRV